ncbi:MAG: hypothetical protein EON91_02720 [Brevundimonas sp.]|uniref:hypothetical protein n=1 Tax=Brevundimonas sp. TaxID=1871086 RepID=UPI0011F8B710|nr:hypothetical protein [Brevundimonas sp.]RZJ19127.1 MAG: hypothetical protein EON91_02720 [Brevundimonas sp.]
MDFWPWDLLTPTQERWRLQGVAMSGGINVAGSTRLTRTDGGGLWVGEQTFLLHGRDRIKAGRAIEAALDGGVGQMVAWSHEAPFAPGDLSIAHVPHSDGAPFGDGTDYAVAPHGAVTTAAAALRATTLTIAMISGVIQGGEHFSITHPVKGVRRYRVARVNDAGDEVVIRPPLREAIASGAELNFLRVGCVCRLANPDDFLGALDARQVVEATALWVEAF